MEGKKKEEKERIMPSLVATTSALARKPCVSTHYVRTNVVWDIVRGYSTVQTSPLSTDDVEMIEQPWSDSQMKCKVQINNDCVFTNYTGHCTET